MLRLCPLLLLQPGSSPPPSPAAALPALTCRTSQALPGAHSQIRRPTARVGKRCLIQLPNSLQRREAHMTVQVAKPDNGIKLTQPHPHPNFSASEKHHTGENGTRNLTCILMQPTMANQFVQSHEQYQGMQRQRKSTCLRDRIASGAELPQTPPNRLLPSPPPSSTPRSSPSRKSHTRLPGR